jgi:hypothetical protein
LLPVKVSLLGAPNSGKSKFARSLARRLNRECEQKWKVIDGYVDSLAKQTGRTYGDVYDRRAFPLNIQVLAERWRLEDEATNLGFHTITCGSIYETIIYAAAQGVPIATASDEQWMLNETYIAQTMMSALALLSELRFDYSMMFYLPLSKSDDWLKESDRDWSTVVDAKLSEVLEGQGRWARILEGTDKVKLYDAIEIIRRLPASPLDTQSSTSDAGGTSKD